MEDYKKACIIANIGSHYRQPIYTLMEKELGCDFYFGDQLPSPVKTMDYGQLQNYKKTLRNQFFKKFYWQKGSVGLVRKPYTYYVMDGEPYCLSSWVILLLAKIYGKKTIAWTHGWYGRESIVKRRLKKVFFGLHDQLLVYSEYAIGLMQKEGFAPEKMRCIANSLDSDAMKALRETMQPSDIYSRHFHNDHPTLIYCGRIQKSKKLEMLIDALATLRDEGLLLNAVFVGKDVENVQLETYARSKGVTDQVWMYGPCYDHHILSELFFNAAVCVSPGNVGLTAIHALSFGCPLITHGNFPYQGPEFEAIVPGKTGDFFRQFDVHDLTDKIRKWTSMSPESQKQVRQAAYEEIDRKWNIHYQIDLLKQVLHE